MDCIIQMLEGEDRYQGDARYAVQSGVLRACAGDG